METLEAVLRRIGDLKTGLDAEIVHQEGYEGYYTTVGDRYTDWEEWVEGEPRIAEPDTKTREAAGTELQQIYDSSGWYSARYAAGVALGMDVDSQFRVWIKDLRDELLEGPQELDQTIRANAKKDLTFMYHNLPDRDYRIEAGRALGYSPLRIWAHEHPVAAAAAGIAAIVTALGYGLIGYMSK